MLGEGYLSSEFSNACSTGSDFDSHLSNTFSVSISIVSLWAMLQAIQIQIKNVFVLRLLLWRHKS